MKEGETSITNRRIGGAKLSPIIEMTRFMAYRRILSGEFEEEKFITKLLQTRSTVQWSINNVGAQLRPIMSSLLHEYILPQIATCAAIRHPMLSQATFRSYTTLLPVLGHMPLPFVPSISLAFSATA